MAHRIEVELTSQTADAGWTWRAAGAKQPRGTVSADLVPTGAGVGSVLRAEVETGLDGTTVLALLPPKGKTDVRPAERIEVVGTPRRGPDVNVVLAPKGNRRRDDRAGGRRPAGERPGTRERTSRGRDGAAPAVERDGGPPSRGGGGPPARGDGGPRRRTGPARPGGRDGARDAGRDQRRQVPTSTVYRNAVLGSLPPEELPVAEQLVRGGIPAVRQAIEEQNARARADGRPEVTPEPLLAMAERLRPQVALATWKDRASVARNHGKELPLRELRSVVASASTVTLDEEGTALAAALRTALDERVTALRQKWVERITAALDQGRVVDAVRATVRPPEPTARLSAELAVRLAEAAGQAMAADTEPAAWLALLEVVVESPVRRTVKPAGLPEGADEALLQEARRASGYVPQLAKLMGIPIPPPPGPRRPVPARSTGRHAP